MRAASVNFDDDVRRERRCSDRARLVEDIAILALVCPTGNRPPLDGSSPRLAQP